MTARRNKKLKKTESITSNKKLLKLGGGIILTLISLIVALIVVIFRTDLGGTFTLAVASVEGDAKLFVYGLDEDKVTQFTIPKDTIMDVSRQRGEWRMGSVWKLIESENLPRDTFSNTIIKSLHVPVDGWSTSEKTNSLAFLTSQSSLSFPQRIKLLLFSLNKQNTDKEEIDFRDTSYLYEARLADGDPGFKRATEMSQKLRHYFISSDVAEAAEKFEVVNATGEGKYSVSSMLETLETVGVHLLSVVDQDAQDFDCVVQSKSTSPTVEKILNVFDCDYENTQTGNFDAKVILGKLYLERF